MRFQWAKSWRPPNWRAGFDRISARARVSIGWHSGWPCHGAREAGGHRHGVFYAPIDHVFAVRRVLRRLQPAIVVILETEIWPNLFREAKRAGCRPGHRQRPHFRPHGATLRAAALVLSRSAALAGCDPGAERGDARAFSGAGASAARVEIGGNLKYDVRAPRGGCRLTGAPSTLKPRGQSRFGLPRAPWRPRRRGTSMKTTQ